MAAPTTTPPAGQPTDDPPGGAGTRARPAGHRPGRGRRIALWVLGAVVGLVGLVVAAVLVLTNTDWGREQLRRRVVAILDETAHGNVSVGRISGNLLKGITLHDVAITDSTGAPFVKLDSATTRYGLRSLISKKIELSGVTLWRPVIVLDQRPGADWNFARIFPGDTAPRPPKDSTKLAYGDWLVFHDMRLVDGRITVRMPWSPASGLTGTARDSAVAAALGEADRAHVERVPGGFQQVQDFQRLYATLPLVRLAHPDFATRRVEIDSLRTLAYPFDPPAADVRQFAAAVEMDADSVWFRDARLRLPNSQATLSLRIPIDTGTTPPLVVTARAPAVDLRDVQFAYPPLPDSGRASVASLVATIGDASQTYVLRGLDLATEGATARGDVGITLGDTLRLHETDVAFAGITTELIERFAPGVDVPRRGTLAGHVAVDGTQAAMRLDGDVTFDDRRSGRSRVLAAGEIGTADGVFRARGLRVTLEPLQVDLARIAMATLPVGGTVRGTATIDGSTDTRIVASAIDLTHRDRTGPSRVTGRVAVDRPLRFADGGGRLDATLAVRPLSLATVGRFAPAAGLRGSAAGPLRARGSLGDLFIESDLTIAGAGTVAARGRLDLLGTIGYDVGVTTRLFNANAVSTKAPRTSLSARLAARGAGTDPATMTLALAADVSTSTIDTLAIDSSRVRLRVANGLAHVDTLAVRVPGAAADALGTFGLVAARSGELQYRVAVDSLPALARYVRTDTGRVAPRPGIAARQLATARRDSIERATRAAVAIAAGDAAPPRLDSVPSNPGIPRDSLAGTVYAAGTVRGNLEGLDVRGRAGAVDLVAFGSAVQRARVAYNWIGALTPDMGTLAVAAVADSVRAAGFQLDSVDVRATYRKPGGDVQFAVYQRFEQDVSGRVAYAVYPDRREARFDQLRMRIDTVLWASTRPGSVFWGQPGVEVDNIELTNGLGGRIFADGRLPTEGPADLRLEVTRLDVGNVLSVVESDVPVRGLVNLDARITGTGRAPVIAATASIDSASFRGTPIPDLRTRIDYAGLRLTGAADAFALGGRPVARATGTLPINLALQGVTGPRLLAGDASADVRADSVPLDIVSRFTDVLADVAGYASGTATLRGPVRSPTLAGDLALNRARFRVVPLGVTMRDVHGAIRLARDTVVIDSVAGRSGGRIAVRGGIGIRDVARPSFDIRLTADRARVLDSEQGRITADAQISAYGPFDGVFVSGGARVREGVIYIPEPNHKVVVSAGDPAVFAVIDTSRLANKDLVPAQSPLLANLRADVSLGVDRDTWVRSREANVEVYSDGDLRVRVDQARQALVIDGIMTTDRGEYTFLSKRFQIKRGSATFVGTQELDPNVQATAEYEIAQAGRAPLVIRIVIGGTVTAPTISLESDAQPPIPQSDLISYLAFGSNTGQLLSFGGGSSVAGGSAGNGLVGATAALATRQLASVAVGVAVDQLESRTARSLGADVFNITPVPGLPDELAGGNIFGGLETFVEGTQIEFGKYFSPQLFVAFQATPVFFQGHPPIPGFRVEYRFRNPLGLSVESTYQPRFFLQLPTLGQQTIDPQNALGLFLVRRWRF